MYLLRFNTTVVLRQLNAWVPRWISVSINKKAKETLKRHHKIVYAFLKIIRKEGKLISFKIIVEYYFRGYKALGQKNHILLILFSKDPTGFMIFQLNTRILKYYLEYH